MVENNLFTYMNETLTSPDAINKHSFITNTLPQILTDEPGLQDAFEYLIESGVTLVKMYEYWISCDTDDTARTLGFALWLRTLRVSLQKQAAITTEINQLITAALGTTPSN